MSTELDNAIDVLIKLRDSHRVKCDACGCVVSDLEVACPMCGAALPDSGKKPLSQDVIDAIAVATAANSYNASTIDWASIKGTKFNAPMWLQHFKDLILVGRKLGALYSNESVEDLRTEELDVLSVGALLINLEMYSDLHIVGDTDISDAVIEFMITLQRYPGCKAWDIETHCSWVGPSYYQINPIQVGFITSCGGVTVKSRLGVDVSVFLWEIYDMFNVLQELVVLYNTDVEDIFTEQYLYSFDRTCMARWCADKSTSLFAPSRLREWMSSVWNFDVILHDRGLMNKFYTHVESMYGWYADTSAIRKFTSSQNIHDMCDIIDSIHVWFRTQVSAIIHLEESSTSEYDTGFIESVAGVKCIYNPKDWN